MNIDVTEGEVKIEIFPITEQGEGSGDGKEVPPKVWNTYPEPKIPPWEPRPPRSALRTVRNQPRKRAKTRRGKGRAGKR